jgi:hypothetical protein
MNSGGPSGLTRTPAVVRPLSFSIDAGLFGRVEVSLALTTTFGEVKEIVEEKLGIPRSWQFLSLSLDPPAHSGMFHDSRTLQDVHCIHPFSFLVVLTGHKPIRLSDTGHEPFLPFSIRPARDCVRDVKQFFDSADYRVLFNGRELADDFAFVNLPPPAGFSSYSIVRLVAAAAESMQVRIQTRDGRSISIAVKTSDGIAEVKEQIEEQEGIPIAEQRLFLGWRELQDHRIIGDYGIRANMTLHLRVRGAKIAAPDSAGNGSPSIEITLNNLADGTISSVQVDAADAISAAAPSLTWAADREFGARAWLRGAVLDASKSFADYGIRSGTVWFFMSILG